LSLTPTRSEASVLIGRKGVFCKGLTERNDVGQKKAAATAAAKSRLFAGNALTAKNRMDLAISEGYWVAIAMNIN